MPRKVSEPAEKAIVEEYKAAKWAVKNKKGRKGKFRQQQQHDPPKTAQEKQSSRHLSACNREAFNPASVDAKLRVSEEVNGLLKCHKGKKYQPVDSEYTEAKVNILGLILSLRERRERESSDWL